MPSRIELSGFSAPYASLTGTLALSASHLDLTRAMLTVGYPSARAAISVVGQWRAKMLQAMIKGYLNQDLTSTNYYRNLEQSEKVAVSFLMGQAFTYWFAEKHMHLPFLVHVQGTSGYNCTPSSATTPLKMGAVPTALRSRPDFIGFKLGHYHVFESKGRSKRPSNAERQKALYQASMISSINGLSPSTRVACFFVFKANGVVGIIEDPPVSERPFDLYFDTMSAIRKSFAFFLEPFFQQRAREVRNEFVGIEIDEGLTFAIDKKLLSLLDRDRKDPNKIQAESVLSFLEERGPMYVLLRDTDLSAGLNGTLLIENRPKPTQNIKKRRISP
ncbi:hypothetical protein [Azospirillum ramasamyi]|uniref:hypothetical protein n=1 Tax=Azospirillum ramasamyi TaxID=682998 RepID=UPI0013A6A5EB|nr:hypothetical protein [Azospirillum ramasamyi]